MDTSLFRSLRLWETVLGLTAALGCIASPPAYAQEKKETSLHEKSKEYLRKVVEEKFQKWAAAKAQLGIEQSCGANNKAINKANAALTLADIALEDALDAWILDFGSDLTDEEKQAVDKYNAAHLAYLSSKAQPGSDEAFRVSGKQQKAFADFREKLKTKREKIREALLQGKELTLASPTDCPSFGIPQVAAVGQASTATIGIETIRSNTTFATPSSTLNTHATGALVNLGGTVQTPGGWFLTGTFGFGPAAGGSFTEGSGSGTVTAGSIFAGHADVGFNVLRGPGYAAGPIVGYGFFNENLGGTIAGSSNSEFSINNQTWQSPRVGVAGRVALPGNLLFDGSAIFMPRVQAQSGAFTGRGNGFQLNVALSTSILDIKGLQVGIFAQYTNMTASGSLATSPGFPTVPVDTKNDNLSFGIKADLVNFVLDFPLVDTWSAGIR